MDAWLFHHRVDIYFFRVIDFVYFDPNPPSGDRRAMQIKKQAAFYFFVYLARNEIASLPTQVGMEVCLNFRSLPVLRKRLERDPFLSPPPKKKYPSNIQSPEDYTIYERKRVLSEDSYFRRGFLKVEPRVNQAPAD